MPDYCDNKKSRCGDALRCSLRNLSVLCGTIQLRLTAKFWKSRRVRKQWNATWAWRCALSLGLWSKLFKRDGNPTTHYKCWTITIGGTWMRFVNGTALSRPKLNSPDSRENTFWCTRLSVYGCFHKKIVTNGGTEDNRSTAIALQINYLGKVKLKPKASAWLFCTFKSMSLSYKTTPVNDTFMKRLTFAVATISKRWSIWPKLS